MKVSVLRGGGIGGMLTRTEVGTDALPRGDAEALERCVHEAGLTKAEGGSGPAHPDELSYEITVEEGGRRRTTRVSENEMPEAARKLIEWVDSRPERDVRVEPPGGVDDRSRD
jgi:hypothetical protein